MRDTVSVLLLAGNGLHRRDLSLRMAAAVVPLALGSEVKGWALRAVLASLPEATVYQCHRPAREAGAREGAGRPEVAALAITLRERFQLGFTKHLPSDRHALILWRDPSRRPESPCFSW
jgi:hypothetical protein